MQAIPCSASCVQNALFAACDTEVALKRHQGRLSYEAYAPELAEGQVQQQARHYLAHGFSIASVIDGAIVEIAVTDAEGRFELPIRAEGLAHAEDSFLILPHAFDAEGQVVLQTLNPSTLPEVQLDEGLWEDGFPSAQPMSWLWPHYLLADNPDAEILISEGMGSSYAHLYQLAFQVRALGQRLYPEIEAPSFNVWFSHLTNWDCGSCFAPQALANISGEGQLFIGESQAQTHWNDALLLHELGHWWMSAYGILPIESGPYTLGLPTHPGLAWSEGFATWFSSTLRDSPVYFQQQDGLWWWVDLETRLNHEEALWTHPQAELGLEQLIDPHEIAHALWGLSHLYSPEHLLETLAHPRMTQAPFLRGYQARHWESLDAEGLGLPYVSQQESTPYWADFLDALLCSHTVLASDLDAFTQPHQHYPYPSETPLCQRPQAPLRALWQHHPEHLALTLSWSLPLTHPLSLQVLGETPFALTLPAQKAGQYTLWIAKVRGASSQWEIPRDMAVELSSEGANLGFSGRLSPQGPLAPQPHLQRQPLAPLHFKALKLAYTTALDPVEMAKVKARLPPARPLSLAWPR